ncbi:MAG: flavocytochrome c [Erysipelotrichaceae bacterium]|nr:flavocytochrome c [Erysipelotrichaceae bacterium]MDY5251236.1 flavocytochrome c [Erysipelotrichaceae bacterium]
MKKLVNLILTTLMIVSLGGCANDTSSTGKYKEGTIEIKTTGFGGEMVVSVEFSQDAIKNVSVGENGETPELGGKAIEEISKQIVEKQSSEVDVVSGATITSKALIDAVNKAIAQASGQETSANVEVKDGRYEGEAEGKKGPIKVAVTIAEGKIADVEVLEAHETIGFEKAFDIIKQDMIATNSTDVDTLTSATMASGGMIRACVDALEKAGMAQAFASAQGELVRPQVEAEYTADVIIVGAGGAGLAAAIEANKAGASVLVVEKSMLPGGNTKLSDGALNASETSVQKEMGIEDSNDGFYNDTFVGGGELANPELVRKLVDESAQSIEFLKEAGVNWYNVITGDGATGQRVHMAEGAGAQMFDHLYNYAMDQGIEIIYNTEITELVVEDGAVVGAIGQSQDQQVTFHANNGVILATGGYGHNGEILGKYDENYIQGTLCTNTVLATGSGIKLGTEVGANLVGMEHVQKHPTCNASTGDLLSSANNGRGLGTTMMVNIDGQRFCEELATRLELSNAILAQPDQKSYSFFDQKAADETEFFEQFGEEINHLIETGEAVKADTIEEACEFFGINYENFMAELEKYNEFAKNGKDEDFNRRQGLREYSTTDGPFYFIRSTPAIHHTMGGLEINTDAQVINTDGEVIKGLYAAGEVTGGIHGNNRLGGNALDDIIVYGRTAGSNAANAK